VSGKKRIRRNNSSRRSGSDRKFQIITAALGGSGAVLAALITALSSHMGSVSASSSASPASTIPVASTPDPAPSTAPMPYGAPASGIPSSSCAQGENLPPGKTYLDPRTLITWSRIYWCPTEGNAIVYMNASPALPFYRMDDEKYIWVTCWVRGLNNEVWYYTQGDDPLPRYSASDSALEGWGFIRADGLDVQTQPDPAVPVCPSPVPAGNG
jgi:hypothetical protein